MQDERLYFEIEKQHLQEFKEKEKALLEQRNVKKLTVVKAKKIDEELQQLREEFQNFQNPYKANVTKALKLRIHDFSTEDKQKAEKILTERKLKTHLKHQMRHNHPHIDMMVGRAGFSSLREFDANNKSPLIKVSISRTQSREEDKGVRSPKNVQVVKRLNLNKNILEEELNSMHIDDKLAEQLML